MKLSNIIFKVVLPVGVIGAAVAAYGAIVSQTPEVETIVEEKVLTVDTFAVSYQQYQPELALFGTVRTPLQHAITSEVNGKLLKVLVSQGERVEAGQVLAEIDDFHAQQAVANQALQISQIDSQIIQNRQQLEQAKQELTVQKRLFALSQNQLNAADNMLSRGLMSDTEHAANVREATNLELAVKQLESSITLSDIQLEQLRLQQQLAENELLNLQRALAQTKIIAPVAGQITGDLPIPGQFISNGMHLAQILQVDQKEVQVQLPTQLGRQLEQSDLVLTAHTDAGTELVLDRVSATVEPGMVGRTAYLTVTDNADLLTTGETTRLFLRLAPVKDVIAVPDNFVFEDRRVYEIVDGKLSSVEFENYGTMMDGDQRYILMRADELENGEQLLATRIANVASGMKVEGRSND